MRLINADSITEEIQEYYDNREELPDPRLADLKRIVEETDTAFDIKKLIGDMDKMIEEHERIKEKAEDMDNLAAAMISDLICNKVRALKESARKALLIPDNEHLFHDA